MRGEGLSERLKARRLGRIDPAVGVHAKDAARGVVRVRRRLGETEDRSEAHVGSLEQGPPLGARPAQEQDAKAFLQRGPCVRVVLRFRVDVGEPQLVEKRRVELRLERADRDIAAVSAKVGVVERRIVEHARPAAVEHAG